jgi:hypothetical protein
VELFIRDSIGHRINVSAFLIAHLAGQGDLMGSSTLLYQWKRISNFSLLKSVRCVVIAQNCFEGNGAEVFRCSIAVPDCA